MIGAHVPRWLIFRSECTVVFSSLTRMASYFFIDNNHFFFLYTIVRTNWPNGARFHLVFLFCCVACSTITFILHKNDFEMAISCPKLILTSRVIICANEKGRFDEKLPRTKTIAHMHIHALATSTACKGNRTAPTRPDSIATNRSVQMGLINVLPLSRLWLIHMPCRSDSQNREQFHLEIVWFTTVKK